MAKFEVNENCKKAFIAKTFNNCLSDFKVTWEQLRCDDGFVEIYRATISTTLAHYPWVVHIKGRDNANEFWKFCKSARISKIKGRFGFKYSKKGFAKIE